MSTKDTTLINEVFGMQALMRSSETIVFVDVVDSVRLIENGAMVDFG